MRQSSKSSLSESESGISGVEAVARKLRVAVLGATGMVGQRFITLLENHPWFEVAVVAASVRSAGMPYAKVMKKRWIMPQPIPTNVSSMLVRDVGDLGLVDSIASEVDLAFCAVDMPKQSTAELEVACAMAELPVVSNTSAHRSTPDVPVVIPEVNPTHLSIIPHQRKRMRVTRGFIVSKPNCSLQSYVPTIHPLMDLRPKCVAISTYQALSGAGKTARTWSEMNDNIIPFIKDEEEKSEQEPMKIWGHIDRNVITPSARPVISAQCVRVPVSDGHMATVSVGFERCPLREDILSRWNDFVGLPQRYGLPSAPKPFINYFDDADRPQTRLDRDICGGMGIAVGRLRGDQVFDFRFVALSNNAVRGAAGGSILTAELLVHDGYITPK